MDKNSQNKSTNENYLQLMLEPIGTLAETSILTISEDKLRQLGIVNHTVAGVTWTSDGHPITYGIFNENEIHNILSRIETVLDAAIVNGEQRKAVKSLIEDIIRDRQFDMTQWIARRTKEVQNDAEAAQEDNGIGVERKTY